MRQKTSTFHQRPVPLLALAFLLLLSSTVWGQKPYNELTYPKLRKVKVPKVERVELKNGMILFLVEDHELPLINISARIGTGSIFEPADKVGLASITGQVMRTGGTKTMSGDQIDEVLEALAASVETSIGQTSGTARMSALKEDFEKVLPIFADVLMNPAFPDDKIELAKIQARSAIARRNDNPSSITFREFAKLIYGADSPYARHTEYATIDAISRDDLVAFHQQFFHPNNVMLGIVGDFKPKEIIKKIEAAFANWKPQKLNIPELPKVDYKFDRSVYLVNKEDINQTHIMIGHIGGLLNNPDYPALVVMNNILGGSFTSRLFKTVRSRLGLAYSVFGRYGANYNYPGMFYVGGQTKSETTIQAARAMLDEIRKMRESEVTDEELTLAKESYLNSFVFNYDTKAEIVNRIMTYEYYGYPKDFLERTRDQIEAVTKEDVLRVAKKYLHPDSVKILAVGNPEKFDEPLSVLGEVQEIDITIPVPKEELPEATTESVEKGRELIAKTIAALGGAGKLAATKSVKIVADASISMGGQSMTAAVTQILVYPDKQRQEVSLPGGQMVQVLAGDKAWIMGPQGTQDAPESMRQEMVNALDRDLLRLLQLADSGRLAPQALGEEQTDGKAAPVVLLTRDDDFSVKLLLDPETNLPMKMAYQGNVMGRPAKVEEVYSDWRDVEGIRLPFRVVAFADGQKFTETTVKEVQINPKLEPGLFEKKTQ
jgi:predicted Zn-dependent peptidase